MQINHFICRWDDGRGCINAALFKLKLPVQCYIKSFVAIISAAVSVWTTNGAISKKIERINKNVKFHKIVSN